MLSPENPSCSPEVLGTTHPLLLLTLSAVSASVTVTISSSFFFVFYQSVSGQYTCRHVGLGTK